MIDNIIKILMITPLVMGILMLLTRKKIFDDLMLILYSILHFVSSCYLVFFAGKALPAANFGQVAEPVAGVVFETTCVPVHVDGQYFATDPLNSVFLIILSFIFLMAVIYNIGYSRHMANLNVMAGSKNICLYQLMIIAFVWAMTGAILCTDLGIAWVLVEATTLSSAYLIYFNRTKNSIEAAWKYVFMCSIGIALAFVGIIFLNIASGNINSLNFNVLQAAAKSFDPFWLKFAFVFILFGFGTKMGLAPVHFWLPDAHSESPSPISTLLSATLLNSAFLVILRVFNILNAAGCSYYGRVMLVITGLLSLFVTAVFIYHIKNYKRMLAYSSIENMGILAIGTALGGVGYLAVILHLIGHSLAKASFFLTSGNILELYETKNVKSVKGLMKADKKTGWLWLLSFLGICAFPTSVLFISEFLIIKTMILKGQYLVCACFTLLLTVIIYGMARVVVKMTFRDISEEKNELVDKNRGKITLSMYLPQVIMLVMVFTLGVYIPNFLNDIIQGAFAVLGAL